MSEVKRPRGNPAWVKGGPSPNPGGSSKAAFAFTRLIQRRTEPEELYNILMAIARGQGIRVLDGTSYAPGGAVPRAAVVQMPTVKDQLKAVELLVSWGYVKPPTQKQLSIDDGRAVRVLAFDESRLGDDDLAALEGLMARAALPAKGETGA